MNHYHARLRLSAYRPAKSDGMAVFLMREAADYHRLVMSLKAFGIAPEITEGKMLFIVKVDWQDWQSI